MCEIFPEVEKCCFCIELRLAMLFIAVFSVMMGSLGLAVAEQKANASFSNLRNVTEIDEPDEVLSGLNTLIVTGLTGLSAIYILAGLLLLFGNLTDQEGIVQLFVWLVFCNVLIGYLLIIMVVFECVFLEGCMLASMDWLTAAFFLIAVFFYLTLWIYFVTVANSYVINATS